MPRRKQTRPKRMKYSEDGKTEEEDDTGVDEEDGDDDDVDEDTAPDSTLKEDDAESDKGESDNDDLPHKEPKRSPTEHTPVTSPAPQNHVNGSNGQHEVPLQPTIPRNESPIPEEGSWHKKLLEMTETLKVPSFNKNKFLSPVEPSTKDMASPLTDMSRMVTSPYKETPKPKLRTPSFCMPKTVTQTLRPTGYSKPLPSPKPCSFNKTVTKREAKSPREQYLDPFVNNDQPLDLSKKPKKESAEPQKKRSGSKLKYSSRSSPESTCSLANLEKKFGGNSYLLENISNKITPKAPVYSAFGGNLFTSALYSTPPLKATTPETYKSNRTFWPRVMASHSQFGGSKPASSVSPAAKQVASESKYSVPVSSELPSTPVKDDPIDSNGTKYTSLVCMCKKQYETLYELTLHMQKTGHTPKDTKQGESSEFPKLVRGQDMWLNQGSEQTRQILRCIQCGESFKTLPELTIHMMETRHYTNIVGSETASKKAHKCSAYCEKCPDTHENVFKCKTCSECFNDMEGLASHMVVSGHHRNEETLVASSKARSTFPKDLERKETQRVKPTAVPPRPLSSCSSHSSNGMHPEADRSHTPKYNAIPNGLDTADDNSMHSDASDYSNPPDLNKIRCENCGEKIETPNFVEHVRLCVKTHRSIHEKPLSPYENNKGGEVSDTESVQKENEDAQDRNEKEEVNKSDEGLKDTDKKDKQEDYRPSPPLSMLHSTTPEAEGSALKAMENFIERSFTAGMSKPSFFSPKPPTVNGAMMGLSPLRPGIQPPQDLPQPDSTGLGYDRIHKHKYLDPDRDLPPTPLSSTVPDPSKVKQERDPSPVVKTERVSPAPSDPHSPGEKGEKMEKPKGTSSPLQSKYLSDDDNGGTKNDGSALESLQGLVYGRCFSTEHPLDSLQKLIHNTDTVQPHKPNGSQSVIAGTATFEGGGMPSTVILVNPIVTVVPSSSAPPAVQINISTNATPPTECSPTNSTSSGTGSLGGKEGNESEFGEAGDFRCQACNRTFASKGSYRYHLSRCHLSSVKKYACGVG